MKTKRDVELTQTKCLACRMKERSSDMSGCLCPFWPSMPCCPQECGIPKALAWVLGPDDMEPNEAEE